MKHLIERFLGQWREHYKTVFKLLAIFSVVILLDEVMLRRSFLKTGTWLVTDFDLFLMNLATVMLIAGTLILITGRVFLVTALMSDLLLIFGAINSGKYALRNVPLDIEDAFLIREVWALMPQLANVKTFIYVGIFGLIVAGLGIVYYKVLKCRRIKGHQLVMLSVAFLSISTLGVGQLLYSSSMDIMKTGFVYHLSNKTRIRPAFDAAYLKPADSKIKSDIENYENPDGTWASYEKPNVIIIQSEAFWDINKMGIKISENPLKHFEALRDESVYGEMYVPVIGGGTSNTEFEVLTGMTLKNFSSDWYMVYPNELKSPLPSLASIFKANGYKSVALHPYMSWYYNRMNVYKYMGFDEFKSIEYMEKPELYGCYTSDKYLTDEIIKVIEENDKPVFNFAVTMQNHGPYGNFRFEEDQINVHVLDKFSNDSNYFLKNYVQGLYYSDLELDRLIEYLKSIDEPTIVLFYGDHLPMLGDDYLAYRESKYVGHESSSALQQDLRMMTVPYILWSNYSDKSVEMKPINASYMPALILEKLGLEMPNYMKEVAVLGREMPLLLRTYGVDANGETVNTKSEAYQMALARYSLLYKNLRDTRYDSNYKAWIDSKNAHYNEELNQILIEKAEIEPEQTVIKGSNFYEGMTLYVNNASVEFKYVDSGEVEVSTSLRPNDTLKFELLTDDGNIITKSNVYKVDNEN